MLTTFQQRWRGQIYRLILIMQRIGVAIFANSTSACTKAIVVEQVWPPPRRDSPRLFTDVNVAPNGLKTTRGIDG